MYGIEILKQEFSLQNNGIVDAKIDINFEISILNNKVINVIDEIQDKELEENNIYSMVIHFVKPGDTLWKIAKFHKSTVDDIIRINKIENPDKISIGQQLFIPRFVSNKIGV